MPEILEFKGKQEKGEEEIPIDIYCGDCGFEMFRIMHYEGKLWLQCIKCEEVYDPGVVEDDLNNPE